MENINKKNIDQNKMQEALNILLEGDIDLSNVLGKDGLIKQMSKAIVEKALQSEMEYHLGYSRYGRSESNNARNGSFNKNITTDNGVIEITVPRDRDGNFEPALIPKGQSRIDGLDDKILSLYAKGMSLSDIKIQFKELYGADISEALISKITDNVYEEVISWQTRPLEKVYPIVYFDCLVVKVRHEKRIINKSVYVALGIDLSGRKDIIGLWISENESAKFWLNNFTEMKNRGVEDILIACTDNLTGMKEAISTVFTKCEHQLCIVHQIRNSLKYVTYKNKKEVVIDLQSIYKSSTEEEAMMHLELFEEKWGKKYPQIAKSWYKNWDNLVIFLEYPPEIRKIIYTTNSIESVNSQLRKVTKNKRMFPNDESVFKTLYLTINYITSKWSMPVPNWKEAMAHFLIKFDGRI